MSTGRASWRTASDVRVKLSFPFQSEENPRSHIRRDVRRRSVTLCAHVNEDIENQYNADPNIMPLVRKIHPFSKDKKVLSLLFFYFFCLRLQIFISDKTQVFQEARLRNLFPLSSRCRRISRAETIKREEKDCFVLHNEAPRKISRRSFLLSV